MVMQASNRPPRHGERECFCSRLDSLIRSQPASIRAPLQASLDLFDQGGHLSEEAQLGLFSVVTDELLRLVTNRPILHRDFVKVLEGPLHTDCNHQLFDATANAMAASVKHSSQQAIRVLRALERNLVGNGWIVTALWWLASAVPEQVLKCLHDALCKDPSLLGNDLLPTLARARPNRRTIKSWLRSNYPGPQAAAIAFASASGELHGELPAIAVTVMADGNPHVRAAVAASICRLPVRKTYRTALAAALNDADSFVRDAVNNALSTHPKWSKALAKAGNVEAGAAANGVLTDKTRHTYANRLACR